MTSLELLLKKSKRLQSVPDAFLSKLELVQKNQYDLISSIVAKFKRKGDAITADSANFKLVDSLREQLHSDLLTGDYADAVKELIGEMDTQKSLNDQYYDKATGEDFSTNTADEIHNNIKGSTAKKLIAEADTKYVALLEEVLNNAVASNARFDETLKMIRDYVEGGEDKDGQITKYAKVIAHDNFANADRAYGNAIADELELEFYLYAGDELPTTRCFCEARHGKYYHYKEIEAWGNGEDVGECGFPWAGMNAATDSSTIFLYAGGYNCMHSIAGVSIFDVPKEVIQRNIENGNYSPTEGERELLGL